MTADRHFLCAGGAWWGRASTFRCRARRPWASVRKFRPSSFDAATRSSPAPIDASTASHSSRAIESVVDVARVASLTFRMADRPVSGRLGADLVDRLEVVAEHMETKTGLRVTRWYIVRLIVQRGITVIEAEVGIGETSGQ